MYVKDIKFDLFICELRWETSLTQKTSLGVIRIPFLIIVIILSKKNMSNLNIFREPSIKSESPLKYRQRFGNDQVISVSNFLNLEKNAQNHYSSSREIKNLGTNSYILNQIQMPIEQKKGEKPKRMNSKTHNFSKNLVQTLQRLQTPKLLNREPSMFPIELKLWNSFKNSSAKSKRLIHLTFFGINSLGELNGKKLRKYKLEKLNNQHQTEVILAAQKNLRKMVLQLLQKFDLQIQISKRRIKKKKEFKDYFEKFLEELRTEQIVRRMKTLEEQQFDIDSVLDSQMQSDDIQEDYELDF